MARCFSCCSIVHRVSPIAWIGGPRTERFLVHPEIWIGSQEDRISLFYTIRAVLFVDFSNSERRKIEIWSTYSACPPTYRPTPTSRLLYLVVVCSRIVVQFRPRAVSWSVLHLVLRLRTIEVSVIAPTRVSYVRTGRGNVQRRTVLQGNAESWRSLNLLCNLGLNHMCGIVVSVAMKEAGKARTNTREENDGWESLVMLNTPRGARRFTFVPDPPFFPVSENTD